MCGVRNLPSIGKVPSLCVCTVENSMKCAMEIVEQSMVSDRGQPVVLSGSGWVCGASKRRRPLGLGQLRVVPRNFTHQTFDFLRERKRFGSRRQANDRTAASPEPATLQSLSTERLLPLALETVGIIASPITEKVALNEVLSGLAM